MAQSSTTLVNRTDETLPSSLILDSSLRSLSSPRKAKSKYVSKIYEEATELFLTRRLPEALSTIERLIAVPSLSQETNEDEGTSHEAEVANASRKSRVKVWVFYLTLINAIAELGPKDGKTMFGNKVWMDLTGKARDGSIWNEVVETGYEGVDSNVDAEVVSSLATLLLAQSDSQKLNQEHLESYLSASNNSEPNTRDHDKTTETSVESGNGMNLHGSGADTLRDLTARVNIIELYVLHVLPRNGEWEYAKDFISRCELLDEDSREALLQDLHSLEDEELQGEEEYEDVMAQKEDLTKHVPLPTEDAETESADTVRQTQSKTEHRPNNENDYGIDNSQSTPKVPKAKSKSLQATAKDTRLPHNKNSRSPPVQAPRKAVSTSFYKGSVGVIFALQNLTSRMAEHLSRNPLGMLRFVLFLVGLILALSQQNVKNRLGRLTGAGWDKVKRTVGMGLKVSYI